MEPMRNYYTYAYLRDDGTPYYIGKGKGNRAYNKHAKIRVPPPDRILFLKQGLTEEEAFKHEVYMISIFGRKDQKTGILLNFTDGGDGPSGVKRSSAFKKRLSEVNKGKVLSDETRRKMSEARMGDRNHRFGKPLSPEVKEKISAAKRGRKTRPCPPEVREKIAEGMRRAREKKKW